MASHSPYLTTLMILDIWQFSKAPLLSRHTWPGERALCNCQEHAPDLFIHSILWHFDIVMGTKKCFLVQLSFSQCVLCNCRRDEASMVATFARFSGGNLCSFIASSLRISSKVTTASCCEADTGELMGMNSRRLLCWSARYPSDSRGRGSRIAWQRFSINLLWGAFCSSIGETSDVRLSIDTLDTANLGDFTDLRVCSSSSRFWCCIPSATVNCLIVFVAGTEFASCSGVVCFLPRNLCLKMSVSCHVVWVRHWPKSRCQTSDFDLYRAFVGCPICLSAAIRMLRDSGAPARGLQWSCSLREGKIRFGSKVNCTIWCIRRYRERHMARLMSKLWHPNNDTFTFCNFRGSWLFCKCCQVEEELEVIISTFDPPFKSEHCLVWVVAVPIPAVFQDSMKAVGILTNPFEEGGKWGYSSCGTLLALSLFLFLRNS